MSAIQLKEWDIAARWGDECGRRFEELNDVFGKGLARFVSFQIARYTGRYEEARAFMRQYAHDWGRQDTEAMASVELIAEIELLDGDLEKAVRLAAAGAAFREEYGGGSPDALVDLSDAREIARRTLDEERVEELWAEGYRLTREEAVALAFEPE